MSSTSCHAAFTDDSESLDAELHPLHLSGQSTDLFDYFILEEGEESDERLFANSSSSGSCDLMALLSDSRGSAAMDFQEFDNLEGSLNNMHVDDIQDNDVMESSYRDRGRRSQRGRSQSPQASRKRFQINAVSFDPPTQQPQRQASQDDLSMSSYATAPSSPMPNSHQHQPLSEGGQDAKTRYDQALRNLADSMKRTELSRKQVMIQHEMLTQEQQYAISSVKELMQQQQQQTTPQDVQGEDKTRSLSSERSSVMAAFFSGSRCTLTNGLDQSRRQLNMYNVQKRLL